MSQINEFNTSLKNALIASIQLIHIETSEWLRLEASILDATTIEARENNSEQRKFLRYSMYRSRFYLWHKDKWVHDTDEGDLNKINQILGDSSMSSLPQALDFLRDDEEYEYDDEEDDKEFDERKILDELTGSHSIASGNDDDDAEEEEEPKAAPVKKKAVKKRVAKKGVAKKVIKRPSTKAESKEPEISMGQGIKPIKCPSCATVHNVDENTPKFICSCGRRIRV